MKKVTFYVDEAGRGPLAGPVTVGVCLPRKRFSTKLFTDSKALTEISRERAYEEIIKLTSSSKLFFSVGRSTNKDIDTLGIMPSLQKALCEGIFQLLKQLYKTTRRELLNKKQQQALDTLFRKRKITPQVIEKILSTKQTAINFSQLVIDGNHDFGLGKHLSIPIKTIIKGDSKVSYIGLASIAAKVERDRYMCLLGKNYDKYSFKRHKGYGTKIHREAIKKHGCSDIHRKTFCKNILGLK